MKKISVFLFLLFTAKMTYAQLEKAPYYDGKQMLNGWVAKPSEGKKGVLILPAWKGVDDEARQAALDLKREGYIALIADIYGEGNNPQDNTQARMSSSYYKENYEKYQVRIEQALEELVRQGADPNQIAVLGYCFGGTGALEAARGQLPVKGVVSIHGGLSKGNRPNGPVSTKVLVLHGAEDNSVPESDVEAFRQEMKAAQADWQLIYYAGCGHTWTNPSSADYNEVMANRSWKHLLLFLREIL